MIKHKKQPVLRNTEFIERLYTPPAIKLAKYLEKSSITPNQITIISGLLGLWGCILYLNINNNNLIFSFILLQLYLFLDILDGALARVKQVQSAIGKWLDPFFDMTVTFVLVCCYTIGVYDEYNSKMFFQFGLILSCFILYYYLIVQVTVSVAGDIQNSESNSLKRNGKVTPREKMKYRFSLFKVVKRVIFFIPLVNHFNFITFLSLFGILHVLNNFYFNYDINILLSGVIFTFMLTLFSLIKQLLHILLLTYNYDNQTSRES